MLKIKESLVIAGQRSVALFVMFIVSTMMLWSQEMNEKFSMTTQMFMNELREQALQQKNGPRRSPRLQLPDNIRMQKSRRLIASPDTIGDVAYISCFIHLKDTEDLSQMHSLGVEVEETFEGQNFVTARVPVKELVALADIDNVTRIKVAQQMRPLTDVARQTTNVDDLLTQSSDAITSGVTSQYDGSGVVLGIIDTGIDFQHITFKDKDGKSRIKRAYVFNGSSAREYSTITSSSPTTDDNAEDHGTHTASTAGGSSVIVSGSTVTVTDNHASATYGGIAPGADLYLAGIYGLNETYLANALKKMVTYADGQGKPLVVSNSWGSGWGPRDGTGEWARLVGQYFGDSHPNHIILFASSNDAGHRTGNEGGGFFVKKKSVSSSSPLGTIIRTDGAGGSYYQGLIACAWNASNSNRLCCKLHVLDGSGAIKRTWTITSTTTSLNGLSKYYYGSMDIYIEQDNGKYSLALYSEEGLQSEDNYTLALEVYPADGSAHVNMWAGDWSYFTNHLTTSGHKWMAGTDDMCVSDEATIPDAISVGAYVSKKKWRAHNGSTYSSNYYTVGDIAYFSSYATADQSPTGLAYPWITAPGARLAAGVNHYHTASIDNYSYYGSSYNSDLVVNNSNYPYAMMEGTSMSTPVAAGIVALWLQAAKSVEKDLTVNDVKNIMEQTAITDNYTTGSNATHFGKGKIDALAGIQYILASSTLPLIMPSTANINFTSKYAPDLSKTETITVRGKNLETDINITLHDPSGTFSVSDLSIPVAVAETGTDITVTWAPTTISETTATLILSSNGADDVVINLTGSVSLDQTYALVTDASTLAAGDKILITYINGDDKYVLSSTQRTSNRAATNDVTLNDDGTLTPGNAAQVITLEKDDDEYLFNVGNGYLYAASSGSNYLKTETTPDANGNAKAVITISNGDATIIFQGTNTRNMMGFNPNNGTPIFSCYGGTSQVVSHPQIYREAPIALYNYSDSNVDIIRDLVGQTVNISLVDRTLCKDGSWNAICLPFDVTIEESPLAGADVRTMSSANFEDGTLTLNFTEEGAVTTIVAGTPYILKWTSGSDITNPVFKDVTLSTANSGFTSNDGRVRFKGTYNLMSFDTENPSIRFIGPMDTLDYPLAGAKIGAFHSYFQLKDISNISQIVLNFDGEDEATSLSKELRVKNEESKDAWYDLSGRRIADNSSTRPFVNSSTLPKGIYIHNGRKEVLK